MLAYFVVVFSLIGVGIFKLLSMKSDLPPGLPLGFDEKPKPGMRLVQKLKELIRKIIRDKVRIFTLNSLRAVEIFVSRDITKPLLSDRTRRALSAGNLGLVELTTPDQAKPF